MEVTSNEEPEDYEDYLTLINRPLENPKLKVLRLDNPTPKYLELESEGILPPWPGPGYCFKITCAPAHRSDTDRQAYKTPMVYVLDDESSNPLHCTDIFKKIGAMYCYKCPSTNGSIGSCCHIAFLIMWCGANYMMESTITKGVRMVNIKNQYPFLHPDEAMTYAKSAPIPVKNNRTSTEKRPHDPFYRETRFMNVNHGDDDSDMTGTDEMVEIEPSANPINNECTDFEPVIESPVLKSLELGANLSIHPVISEPVYPADNGSQPGSEQPESIASSASGFFGAGTANVERYLQRMTRKYPDMAIPEVHPEPGIFFYSEGNINFCYLK